MCSETVAFGRRWGLEQLLATVDDNVVAIGSASRKRSRSTAKILEVAGVLRGKNIVCQENAAGIQHARDIGHGQRLLKTVVVHKNVGSD